MKKLICCILCCCMILVAAVAFAQDTPKAKKMENHKWHQVVMVKFKAGKMDKAMKIIDNHFAKAGMDAGVRGPDIMQFKSGEWDMMFVWNMDSIEDMDWEVSPDDEKWWAQMAKQEGGMDKAMEVMQGYLDLVESSTSYLATSRSEMAGRTMGSRN